MKSIAFAALLLIIAPALPAQKTKEASASNPVVSTVRQMEEHYSKNLIGAADEMPADKYSFKPTPQQMTFGHLMAHVAEMNNMLCGAIAGETSHSSKASETDSKEALTQALKDSFSYCQQVLAKADDSTLGQTATLGSHTGTRGAALVHLAADWGDHYSAAATYLRLNNLLPPSAKHSEGK